MLLASQSRAADEVPAVSEAPGDVIDTHPWNPDVRHGNDWPYAQPLVIDSNYYGPPGDFWIRAEYLFWQLEKGDLPPLVTTGPTAATPLVGGNAVDPGTFSGGRFAVGVWFDVNYTRGLEGSYFFLSEKSATFTAGSLGQADSPVLARPFLNIVTGEPALRLLAAPGRAAGFAMVQASTELQGAEATFVWNLCRGPIWSFDLLPSFRYLNLNREVIITDGTLRLPAGLSPGLSTATQDQFAVRNSFFGGEIGGRATYRWHCLLLSLTEKVALGANTADTGISGSTARKPAGGKTTAMPGGLLTQLSNFGRHADDTFSVVNELNVQAGWQIHNNIQLFGGYTFLYASSVVQPGDVIDLGVNPVQGPFQAVRPAFHAQQTDFWAHGLNVGLELRY